MNLQKRECPIKMRIVPYGGGWTDVYVDFGDGELYFIISHCLGDNFSDFMKLLYHLYPEHDDTEELYDEMDYQYAVAKKTDNGYETDYITDDTSNLKCPFVYHNVPWKTGFVWDEEGSDSVWHLEREPNEETDFMLHIDIKISRSEDKEYHYDVSYKELCYALAKAYTEMIKKHGFLGYHRAVYSEDIQMRYFLFFKAYALGCLDAIELARFKEKGEGERSSLANELELLLFDM